MRSRNNVLEKQYKSLSFLGFGPKNLEVIRSLSINHFHLNITLVQMPGLPWLKMLRILNILSMSNLKFCGFGLSRGISNLHRSVDLS